MDRRSSNKHSKNKQSVYCYPKKNPENETLGWCKTLGNYYDWDKINETYQGWGFCSTIYFNKNPYPVHNILMKDNVEVLPEDLCNKLLNVEMPPNIKVNSNILCIASQEHFREYKWQKINDSYIESKVDRKVSD